MGADGILTMPAHEYHADPCDRPSLSASIANILCNSSPKHAWTAHPKLNPLFMREEEAKFDRGTVAHAMLLQGEDVAVVCDYPDWRTNAAKDERDAARKAGQVPLLAKDWDGVQEMVAAVRTQLADHDADPTLFTDGMPEQTLVWDDDGVLCRARVDWLRDDLSVIDDLKTTARSAHPTTWGRTAFQIGADVQVAFYLRGLEKITGASRLGGHGAFRYVVVENYPPYALSVVELSAEALSIGEAKVEHALNLWRYCTETGEWPAYEPCVSFVDPPAWESRWLNDEAGLKEAAWAQM